MAVTTPRAQRMLDMVPPFYRDEPKVVNYYNAAALELDRIEAAAQEVGKTATPLRATDHLELWENLLGLPVNPPLTLQQRRDAIAVYLRRIVQANSAKTWKQRITEIVGSGSWSWTHNGTTRVISITIPYNSVSGRARLIGQLARDITPANTLLQIFYDVGFVLDESDLDSGGLT